jgi:hypothetical protein
MAGKSHDPRGESMADGAAVESRALAMADAARSAGHIVSLDGHVSEDAAADLLGVSPHTIKNWRCAGRLAHRQLGGRRGRVQYALTELARFAIESERPRMTGSDSTDNTDSQDAPLRHSQRRGSNQ